MIHQLAKRRRRGFTLTEMLFALALIGVASLLSSRLFTGAMSVIRTAPASHDYFAAIDRMSDRLRGDVWGATKIEVSDDHTLVLTCADQTSLRWELSRDGIWRKASKEEQSWSIPGRPELTVFAPRIAIDLESRRRRCAAVQQPDAGDERSQAMRHHRARRGFILLAALAVFAVIAVALLTLAAASSYDGQRTLDRGRRAQLDQMLLAGATDAAERIKSATPKAGETWTVDLPPALTEQDASLSTSVKSADDSRIVLVVRARIANRSAEQTARFEHTADWTLRSATVDETGTEMPSTSN